MAHQGSSLGMGACPGEGLQWEARGRRVDPDHQAPASPHPTGSPPGRTPGPSSLLNVRRWADTCEHGGVKVILRNPRREIDISGARTVINLLAQLDLNREAHLVMRDGELIPGDAALDEDDVIEVRPVISGGDA